MENIKILPNNVVVDQEMEMAVSICKKAMWLSSVATLIYFKFTTPDLSEFQGLVEDEALIGFVSFWIVAVILLIATLVVNFLIGLKSRIISTVFFLLTLLATVDSLSITWTNFSDSSKFTINELLLLVNLFILCLMWRMMICCYRYRSLKSIQRKKSSKNSGKVEKNSYGYISNTVPDLLKPMGEPGNDKK